MPTSVQFSNSYKSASFDLDYPIECDDEYWETEDPNQAFKQPPGKSSTMTGFIQGLKLCEMLAFTLRTLYSTKKSKVLSGLIGNEWEERIVAQLTTAMNVWKDSLPTFRKTSSFVCVATCLIYGQCIGIRMNKTLYSFISRHIYLPLTITFKYLFTVHF